MPSVARGLGGLPRRRETPAVGAIGAVTTGGVFFEAFFDVACTGVVASAVGDGGGAEVAVGFSPFFSAASFAAGAGLPAAVGCTKAGSVAGFFAAAAFAGA